MKIKKEVIILTLVSALIFLLVFSPHFSYPFPYHIDEWHGIGEALKLSDGSYTGNMDYFELGFHLFLFGLSKIFNLVLIYEFLPAIWAILSALALFWLVYKKSDNFYLGILSMIFFASIKSNVNITGLWFFTPLTFAMPLIFLYVYFFTEGVEKKNKKFILISLTLMTLIVFIHAPSFLFFVPISVVYLLFHLNYIKKEWKFFCIFLAIPIIGILFFKFALNLNWNQLIPQLVSQLQFKYGWGVLEINNSPLELYSIIGYCLAILGIVMSIKKKNYRLFIIWPLVLILSIIIFKVTKVSYLVPYQRNLYYFAIVLPVLSALGTYYLISSIESKLNIEAKKTLTIALILLIMFLTFTNYYSIPERISLYQVINQDDYKALSYLQNEPPGELLATPFISTAAYPISKKSPIASLFFDNLKDRNKVQAFFDSDNCTKMNNLIKELKPSYILSTKKIDCNWKIIYSEKDYIYKI